MCQEVKSDVNTIMSLLNDACRAYIIEEFNMAMTKVERFSIQAVQYLKKANISKWA